MVAESSKAHVKVDQFSVQHMTSFSRWRGGTTSSFDIFDSPLGVQLPGIVAWRSAVTRRDKPPVARAIRFGLTGVVIEAATSHGGFGHFPRFSSFPTRSHAWGNLHSHRPRRSSWVRFEMLEGLAMARWKQCSLSCACKQIRFWFYLILWYWKRSFDSCGPCDPCGYA